MGKARVIHHCCLIDSVIAGGGLKIGNFHILICQTKPKRCCHPNESSLRVHFIGTVCVITAKGSLFLVFFFRILTEKAQIGQNDIYFGPFSVVSDLVRVRKTRQTTGDY